MIVKSQAEMAKNLELVSGEVQTQINGKASTVHTHNISAIVDTGYPVIKPSLNLDFANSKHVDPRITFTRASSGTIYNEDGLIESVASGVPRITHNPVTGECEGLQIEEARTNLLTYSEQFDNAAWGKSNVTIIPNAGISPDGNTTMDLLADNIGTVGLVYCFQYKTLTANTTYTLSVFVKRKDYRYVGINPGITSNWAGAIDLRIFDLETATQTSGTAGGLIEHIGNGVYRVSITVLFGAVNAAGGINIHTSSSPTTNNVQRTVGLGNYIWGAQIEAGTEPSSYIPSTESFTSRASAATYYGSDGLLKSAPVDTVRMNYNPTNLKIAPRMLLEGASTNLLTYSEQFDNAAWGKTRVNISANTTATLDPYGTNLADKAVEDTSINLAHIAYRQIFDTTSGVYYTHSVFVKAAERSAFMLLALTGSSIVSSVDFDLVGVTATPRSTSSLISQSITPINNGWYRCSITVLETTSTTGTSYVDLRISDSPVSSSTAGDTYTGDGTSGLYIFGAQLEVGAYPTSYIPTTTTAVTRAADIYTSAASTRAADVAYMDGANFLDWYRQDEGTIVVEAECTSSSTKIADIVAISDGTTSNRIKVSHIYGTFTDLIVIKSGILQVDTAGVSIANKTYQRHSVAFKNNDTAETVNGSTAEVDNTCSIPISNKINIGCNEIGSGNFINGHIKSLQYYPKRLTNVELQALSI